MRRVYPLIIIVFMLTICFSGCLGSEDTTDDIIVESPMQMIINEEDFPANWHKSFEIMSTGFKLWNWWQGQDFRECAERYFQHYLDNESSIYSTASIHLFSYNSEQKADECFNYSKFDDYFPTWRAVNLGDDGIYYNSSFWYGYRIRVGSIMFDILFYLLPGYVEYDGWSEDLVEVQVAMIRDMLPFWSGYQDPVCLLEIEADSLIVPSNVTFIMKAGEGDGAIANWTLDINSDGIPEYSGEGQPPRTINLTYEIPVTFKATLWVTDVQGDQANSSDGLELKMINKAPVCSIFALPDTGEAPLMVNFSIHINDPNDDRVYYEFDIDGDGKIDYNGTIWGGSLFPKRYQHIYGTPGEYQVNLSVSDGRGGYSSDSITIIVT